MKKESQFVPPRGEVYGRGPIQKAEDLILCILELPTLNVNRENAQRMGIQVKRINGALIARAEALLEEQPQDTKEAIKWALKVRGALCYSYIGAQNK